MVLGWRFNARAISPTECRLARSAAIEYLSSLLNWWYATSRKCRTYFLNPSRLTRRQSQRQGLSRVVLQEFSKCFRLERPAFAPLRRGEHASRQALPWLIFDVGQKGASRI